MREQTYCEYCGEYLGNLHDHSQKEIGRDIALLIHFKEKHQKELAEMKETKKELQRLQEKYHYYSHIM